MLILSGCSGFRPKTEITIAPIEKPELVLPTADRLSLRNVEWVLITEKNYRTVFDKLKKNNHAVVLFGLTSDDYENLGLNMSDIRAFILQQKAIVSAYKRYYEQAEKAIDQANEQTEQP